MVQYNENVSKGGEVTKNDMRHSGIPVPGKLGAAKKQVWALAIGILVVVLIIVAAIIDVQV